MTPPHDCPIPALSPQARTFLWTALEKAWAGLDDTAHDLAHVARVRATTLRLAASNGAPVDGAALEAATILHDLVAVPKNDPRRSQASRLSAEAAAPLLAEVGFTPASIAIAQHAIEAHSWSAGIPPQTLEAWYLRDGDRLDALGRVGLARCIALAGRLGQQLYHPTDPFARHRELDDRLYCHDHFLVKLYGLVDGLHSPQAQEEGARRVAAMRAFWDHLFEEAGVA